MPYINDLLHANQQRTIAPQTASQHLAPPPRTETARAPRLGPSRFRFDPAQVLGVLRQRIIGQEQVLAEMDDLLQVVKADLADPARPLYVALLAGPTGVGKSGLVALLAETVSGRKDALCRIDMNTLAQEHYSAALTGAPPGYVGSKEGHTLFDIQAAEGDFSTPGIVLFDEIEKASPEVIRTLLSIMEEGQLRLTSGGRSINFRNCLIFMTTNLGSRDLLTPVPANRLLGLFAARGSRPRRTTAVETTVEKRIEARFDPEFINRIDRILMFKPIRLQHAVPLVDLGLEQLNQRLRKKGWQITLTLAARHEVAKCGYDARYGARGIRRALRRLVEAPVSRYLLQEDCPAPRQERAEQKKPLARKAIGDWRDGTIVFTEQTL